MAHQTDSLSVYRDLADYYDRLGQASMRDRFLILAADAALQGGQPAVAERLRQRLLQGSRHHMLRSYASFEEASAAPDVQTYLRDLRVNYPIEVARELLEGVLATEGPGSTLRVPPTSPELDMNGPAGTRTWPPEGLAEPYPVRENLERTPAPTRPLPQAIPRRASNRRVIAPAEPGPGRGPQRGGRTEPPEGNPAGWVSVGLGALVFLVAAAAAVLTLGRPFLP